MKNRKEIQEELKSFGITWAASDPCSMPFSYPENYFNTAFQPLASKLSAGLEPNLEVITSKSNPYTIPENYFQDLPENIIESAKALQNVQEIMIHENTKLQQHENKLLYSKPLTTKNKTGLLRSLSPARWLVAATVAVLFCFASYYTWFRNDTSIETVEIAIPTSIPDTEIIKYLEASSLRNELTAISEDGINSQLAETDTELLREVSDEELFTYASQNTQSFN